MTKNRPLLLLYAAGQILLALVGIVFKLIWLAGQALTIAIPVGLGLYGLYYAETPDEQRGALRFLALIVVAVVIGLGIRHYVRRSISGVSLAKLFKMNRTKP